MTNLIIAYTLIAVVLLGYGATLYRRLHAVEHSIRAREEKD
jgi:hypothetical protein